MADNALQTRALVTAIKAAIQAAWRVPIYLRRQDLPQAANAGYAILSWLPVTISFSGPGGAVSSPSQRNRFRILGRFLYPTDPSVQVDLLKADLASALIAELQTGPDFAGMGLLPLVTEVDPQDLEPAQEGAFDLSVIFECYTVVGHH